MAKGLIKKCYYGLVQGENLVRHPLLLILRLYWGSLFILTGLGKLLHPSETTGFFASLSIPYPATAALLVGLMECLGGISLLIGFLSRIFSLLLVIILATAYIVAHPSIHNIFNSPTDFINDEPFLYLLTALLVLCFGPGFFSVDYWMEKRHFGKSL